MRNQSLALRIPLIELIKKGQVVDFFATSPKGISALLAQELRELGAEVTAEKLAGVAFRGSLEIAYKACLWSRLANRILLPLKTFPAEDPVALYQGIQQINWSDHLSVENTLAVDFSSNQSMITHTQFGAQKVKDAIVDQFRQKFGSRPSVEVHQPSVLINVYIFRDQATVSIDLSGESLHRRGYRTEGGEAPLKENLAAALLIRAGWPTIAAQNGAFVDIMCGSGTLPIEAALMAGNIAPGLLREYFGFKNWRFHQPQLWEELVDHARKQRRNIPMIIGYDADAKAIQYGLKHVQNAGLSGQIHLEKRELIKVVLTEQLQKHPGLVMANPPYGERMGEVEQLSYLYQSIGEKFRRVFTGWHAAIFTGNTDLGKKMGIRAHKIYAFFNGPIACKLLTFNLENRFFIAQAPLSRKRERVPEERVRATDDPINMFVNRLEKNMKHLQKWAKRENISCYRIYDADLPEYAMAIDYYEQWIHVQEYAAPKTIDADKAAKRLQAVIDILPSVLNIPAENIFCKVRKRQTKHQQYQKLAQTGQLFTIHENNAKFLINLTDYLDSGIFLDQRITRDIIQQSVKNKRFLNLFAYTATATIYAALGGASETTTVDMSATYLSWAKKNLALNGFSEHKHHFIQADCLQWLTQEKKRYDFIYVEPPTFSRSKRMEQTFDVQRDHVSLLRQLLNILSPQGKIIFATNKQNFKLDESLIKEFILENISKKTLPLDFARSAANHHCWILQRR